MSTSSHHYLTGSLRVLRAGQKDGGGDEADLVDLARRLEVYLWRKSDNDTKAYADQTTLRERLRDVAMRIKEPPRGGGNGRQQHGVGVVLKRHSQLDFLLEPRQAPRVSDWTHASPHCWCANTGRS